MLSVDPHPLFDPAVFLTRWPAPLGELPSPAWLRALTAIDAFSPFPPPSDAEKAAVRDLLRYGGFKPAGRSKPCNEYILGVAAKGEFPLINAAVDATNVAVLHGGLPISTVDLDLLAPPLLLGIAPSGARYVFNASGQEIDLAGLLCLHDAAGPCANPVKDSLRAKTTDRSQMTITVIYGTRALPGRTAAVLAWHRALNERLGGAVEVLQAGG